MPNFIIHPLAPADREWVARRVAESWGAESVIAHRQIFRPAKLPGFAAEAEGEIIGLLSYHIEGQACEIVTLDSWCEGLGVGSALIEAMTQAARQAGCRRLWLITTNDNTHTLRFYQKRGFVIAAVHINAIEKSRRLKPEIPLTGEDGIPIRDEIELEMHL